MWVLHNLLVVPESIIAKFLGQVTKFNRKIQQCHCTSTKLRPSLNAGALIQVLHPELELRASKF